MRDPILRLHLDRDELLIDNFAGGGGASTGLELATGRSPDIAVNHDPQALAMHARNHPATPRELFNAQGFPASYVIDSTHLGPLTKTAQVRMAGNSVCPPVAAALVAANLAQAARVRRTA